MKLFEDWQILWANGDFRDLQSAVSVQFSWVVRIIVKQRTFLKAEGIVVGHHQGKYRRLPLV
jgi:hypothetical protein